MAPIALTNPRFVYEFQKPLHRQRIKWRFFAFALISGALMAILLLC